MMAQVSIGVNESFFPLGYLLNASTKSIKENIQFPHQQLTNTINQSKICPPTDLRNKVGIIGTFDVTRTMLFKVYYSNKTH